MTQMTPLYDPLDDWDVRVLDASASSVWPRIAGAARSNFTDALAAAISTLFTDDDETSPLAVLAPPSAAYQTLPFPRWLIGGEENPVRVLRASVCVLASPDLVCRPTTCALNACVTTNVGVPYEGRIVLLRNGTSVRMCDCLPTQGRLEFATATLWSVPRDASLALVFSSAAPHESFLIDTRALEPLLSPFALLALPRTPRRRFCF